MLLRRGLLSRDIPNTVTIPLLGSFKASNGAKPSVNTGCTLEADGLYIPTGSCVEYKISDLYPKAWTKIALELDMMYTKTAWAHGWFDFFDLTHGYLKYVGVCQGGNSFDRLQVFDVQAMEPVLDRMVHVIVTADFLQGGTVYPHGEIVDIATQPLTPYGITKPSAIRLGHHYPDIPRDGWKGYVKNVKVTFE